MGESAFTDARAAKPPARTPVEARERDIRRLEVLQGLLERMAGGTLDQLSDAYASALTPPEGADAPDAIEAFEKRKAAILISFESQMLERLGPLVLAVYEAQLKMGNLDAARDIGVSLGIIKKPATAKVAVAVSAPAPKPEITVNSIEDYRLARQERSYKGPRTRSISFEAERPS